MANILRGRVVPAIGSFAFWIDKLADHYPRKTGMRLFPGTLNIHLDSAWTLPENPLRLEGSEYGGPVSVSLVPCSIRDRRAFILRTDANEQGRGHHPKTIIEIATDVKLRDLFSLKDGDLVEIELTEP